MVNFMQKKRRICRKTDAELAAHQTRRAKLPTGIRRTQQDLRIEQYLKFRRVRFLFWQGKEQKIPVIRVREKYTP